MGQVFPLDDVFLTPGKKKKQKAISAVSKQPPQLDIIQGFVSMENFWDLGCLGHRCTFQGVGNNTIMNIPVFWGYQEIMYFIPAELAYARFYDSAICIHCSCSNGISWTMHAWRKQEQKHVFVLMRLVIVWIWRFSCILFLSFSILCLSMWSYVTDVMLCWMPLQKNSQAYISSITHSTRLLLNEATKFSTKSSCFMARFLAENSSVRHRCLLCSEMITTRNPAFETWTYEKRQGGILSLAFLFSF